MTSTATTPPLSMDITLDAPDLVAPEQIQQRVALDLDQVQAYAALYREGRDLGPVILFHTHDEDADVHEFYLADGFHRRLAALEAGLTTLPALVYEGTFRDAIFYATSCNLHGKPLTNADKRKRVLTLLQDPEWGQWSDSAIAKHCGVTHPFVGAVRKSLVTVTSDETEQSQAPRTYTDRYGHTRTMDTHKIGQKAAGTCGICGRPLSAPGSVSRGIGPICAGHGNGAAGARGGLVVHPSAPIGVEIAPAAMLAGHFDMARQMLERLYTALKDAVIPDVLEPHIEACIALGKVSRKVEDLTTHHKAVLQALSGKLPARPGRDHQAPRRRTTSRQA